jgi:hypothetical protein
VARLFRYEAHCPCSPLGGTYSRNQWALAAQRPTPLVRVASSSDALPMGLRVTNWELGFNRFRFHHVKQVLRVCDFGVFSSPPALPPCYGPLGLSALGKVVDLWDLLRVPSQLCWECVISCRGARSRRTRRASKIIVARTSTSALALVPPLMASPSAASNAMRRP